MARVEVSAVCDAHVRRGQRCGHALDEHLWHGPALLECWRCEDWHYFVPRGGFPDAGRRRAA